MNTSAPMKLYGLKVSYFTGKLEGYLRYKEIPYEFVPAEAGLFTKTLPQKTGAMQVPAVELSDGRWMTDTSPMIDWFEGQHADHPILPTDPVQAYLCRLIEDYADEWMWRPAMHYRWSYPTSATLLCRQIVDEIGQQIPAPNWIKRWRTRKRQHTNFVKNDGVNAQTWDHVERSYTRLLEVLNPIFEKRDFLFGARPTLADIGLFGPLFRHFSMDPDPAILMRETAPAVMEWVYRLWNTKASQAQGDWVSGVPDDLLPLLAEIGETHLQNLCANAEFWQDGQSHFGVQLQGADYTNVPTSRYRVWCLEKLQQRFGEVPEPEKATLTDVLEKTGCLEPLMRLSDLSSDYDAGGQAPFGTSIPVYAVVKG